MVESIQAEKVKSASTERTQFTLSRGFRTIFQQETSKRIQELNNALLISLLPTTYHLIPFSCPKCLGMCTYIRLTSTLFLPHHGPEDMQEVIHLLCEAAQFPKKINIHETPCLHDVQKTSLGVQKVSHKVGWTQRRGTSNCHIPGKGPCSVWLMTEAHTSYSVEQGLGSTRKKPISNTA